MVSEHKALDRISAGSIIDPAFNVPIEGQMAIAHCDFSGLVVIAGIRGAGHQENDIKCLP